MFIRYFSTIQGPVHLLVLEQSRLDPSRSAKHWSHSATVVNCWNNIMWPRVKSYLKWSARWDIYIYIILMIKQFRFFLPLFKLVVHVLHGRHSAEEPQKTVINSLPLMRRPDFLRSTDTFPHYWSSNQLFTLVSAWASCGTGHIDVWKEKEKNLQARIFFSAFFFSLWECREITHSSVSTIVDDKKASTMLVIHKLAR